MRKLLISFLISIILSLTLLYYFQLIIHPYSPLVYSILLAPSLIISWFVYRKSFDILLVFFKQKVNQKNKIVFNRFLLCIPLFSFLSLISQNFIFFNITLPQSLTTANQLIREIHQQHHVEIVVEQLPKIPKNYKVTRLDTKGKDLLTSTKLLGIIKREFKKYPKDFFQKIKINKIYIGKNLYSSEQPISGMAHTHEGYIMLDIANSLSYLRMTLHHEVAHHLLARIIDKEPKFLNHWATLNDPSFQYSNTLTRQNQRNENNLFYYQKSGFISRYSKKNAKEDFSETLTHLIHSSYTRKQLARNLDSDRILKRKVQAAERALKHILNYEIHEDSKGIILKSILQNDPPLFEEP